ncbi:MAG TPA: hypothetical protein VIR65_03645 [Rhizorhapis sp.]|jgi:hypothetical protein
MNKDLGEKFSGARENAANALDASREKASELGDEVRMRGTKIIQENPLASLAGGMALGVMLAAFLPKRKGRKSAAASKIAAGLLAAKGVSASASDRIVRTKDRMKDKIEDIDLDAAKEKISSLAEKASDVVSSATRVASETLRRK